MPVYKSFSDEIWARIQASATMQDFDNVEPLGYVHDLASTVLGAPDTSSELRAETARADAAEAELVRQRQIIDRLMAHPQPTITDTSATDPNYSRADKIPDPPMFNGDRSKIRPFIAQLRLKLFSDPSRYPDARLRIAYTINRLEGRAMDQILPHVTASGTAFSDVEDVLKVLLLAFDDPDRAATARHKLQNLRQGNSEFSVYFAQFQVLVSELNWGPQASRDALRNGLSIEILEKLVGIQEPEEMTEFVSLCQRLDSQIRAITNLRSLRTKSTPTNKPTQQNTTPTQNQPRTPQGTFAPSPASVHTTFGPAPMDLSANRRKITPQERASRLAEGRCLYCGGHGHMAAMCPNKPAHMRAAATQLGSHYQSPTDNLPEESGKA